MVLESFVYRENACVDILSQFLLGPNDWQILRITKTVDVVMPVVEEKMMVGVLI